MKTREDFDMLEIYQQVEYINALTGQGMSLTNISKAVGVSRKTLSNRFAKIGYTYNSDYKSYMKAESKNNTSVVEEYKENTGVFLNANMKEKFVWMMSNFDVLESIINERIQGECKENTVIEVNNIGFVIDLPEVDDSKDKAYQTTIRLNKKVWEEFDNMYKTQYSNLNKYDVVSVCFQEFINKYKNKE